MLDVDLLRPKVSPDNPGAEQDALEPSNRPIASCHDQTVAYTQRSQVRLGTLPHLFVACEEAFVY